MIARGLMSLFVFLLVDVVRVAHAAPGDPAPASARGIQAELRLRQDEPAFAGEGQGSAIAVLRPWAMYRAGPQTLFSLTGKLFASSRDGADVYATSRDTERQYGEVIELWVQRDAASYPLQFLRMGIQPVADGSTGIWWDHLLTGVVARLDSSLLDISAGIGSRSSYLRTDTDVTSPEGEQAQVAFLQGSRLWRIDNRLTWRAANRTDADTGYQPGDTLRRADFTRSSVNATWVSAEASGEWRTDERDRWPRYLVELGLANGDMTEYGSGSVAGVPESLIVRTPVTRDIAGLMWRVELQYVFERWRTWRMGIGFLHADGGDSSGDAGFVQTGMESNRGDLFGTAARGHVTGEAMRLSVRNIDVYNLHAAFSLGSTQDMVIAWRDAYRAEAGDDVFLGGVRLPPTGGQHIGQSIDINHVWRQPRLFSSAPLMRSGFSGRRVTTTASWFDPAFPDPARTVTGLALNLEFLQTF